MKYSNIIPSFLAATGAFAAPAQRRNDNQINVQLSNSAAELGVGTSFDAGICQEKPVRGGDEFGFTSVELVIDENGKNDALRCQILDDKKQPIVVVRGENIDVTFADGNNGAWTFRDGESKVSNIICDPEFKKGFAPPVASDDDESAQKDLGIRVTLSDGNLAIQTAFNAAGKAREKRQPQDTKSKFSSVELSIGDDIKKQNLRCQLLDRRGHAIRLQRGANIDTTFADGDGGAWKFLEPHQSAVEKIICDPAFIKAAQ